MAVTIRAAELRDAEAIAAIWNQIIRDTTITFTTVEKHPETVAGDIAAKQASGEGYLVAEEAGQLLGLACYGPFRGGPGYRHSMEHTVYLNPQAKGRGIGRQLLRALELHAKAAGHHCLIAAISGENTAAQQFHAAVGYAEVARVPEVGRKFDRWLDMVLMQKIL